MPVRSFAAATVSAAAAVLLFGSGTAAASITLPLHAAHRNTTAAGFPTHSCDQIPVEDQGAGKDGFVFVLPKNDANFVSLTLSFRDLANHDVTILIPNPADAYPDGITSNGTSKAWVVVPSGWTLLDGTAVVDNDNTKAEDFNLTHTCPGTTVTPSPTPSASVSASVSPSASVSASESDTVTPSPSTTGSVEGSTEATPGPSTGATTPGGGGSLPLTGAAVTGTAMTGAALIAGGIVLMSIRRRRTRLAFVADPDAADPSPSEGDTL